MWTLSWYQGFRRTGLAGYRIPLHTRQKYTCIHIVLHSWKIAKRKLHLFNQSSCEILTNDFLLTLILSYLLQIVGNLLYYRYINSAIVAPDAFDIINVGADKALTNNQRRNLGSVAKILQFAAANKGVGFMFFSWHDCIEPLVWYSVLQFYKI